jgi:hypothetical protein
MASQVSVTRVSSQKYFLSTREAGERIKVRGVSMIGEISKMSFLPAISPSPSFE